MSPPNAFWSVSFSKRFVYETHAWKTLIVFEITFVKSTGYIWLATAPYHFPEIFLCTLYKAHYSVGYITFVLVKKCVYWKHENIGPTRRVVFSSPNSAMCLKLRCFYVMSPLTSNLCHSVFHVVLFTNFWHISKALWDVNKDYQQAISLSGLIKNV